MERLPFPASSPKKRKNEYLLDDDSDNFKNNVFAVGIDFGNLNTVVAVARNRGVDVITNEVSNRATPSLVSFGDKQRYVGESAKTQEICNFKSTVSTLKRLIGRPFSDPDVKNVEQTHVNVKLVEGERGEVAVEVPVQSDSRVFTFTQLTARFFDQVKDFTQKELQKPVSEVVVSVPGWFTDRQRRALLDAAEIAGLSVLCLMNELTASAVAYGLTKLDLPDPAFDPKVKPRTVVFFDLGHSNLQVGVVQFVKGKLVVKGTAYDRNLGGRDFDDVLANHFVKEFDAKYKMNIRGNGKALFRLRQACEKVKKVLSANSNTDLNIGCLLDDKDVSAQVARADYMEWVQPLIGRLQAPVEEALKAAELTASDIDFVELVGGSTRNPAVKEFLAKLFGGAVEGDHDDIYAENKLSTVLNQDEAVARGCALQCALISSAFKVRDLAIHDWNGYPIHLAWDANLVPPTKAGEPAESDIDAFAIGNAIPSAKALPFFPSLREEELAANAGVATFDVNALCGADAVKRLKSETVREMRAILRTPKALPVPITLAYGERMEALSICYATTGNIEVLYDYLDPRVHPSLSKDMPTLRTYYEFNPEAYPAVQIVSGVIHVRGGIDFIERHITGDVLLEAPESQKPLTWDECQELIRKGAELTVSNQSRLIESIATRMNHGNRKFYSLDDSWFVREEVGSELWNTAVVLSLFTEKPGYWTSREGVFTEEEDAFPLPVHLTGRVFNSPAEDMQALQGLDVEYRATGRRIGQVLTREKPEPEEWEAYVNAGVRVSTESHFVFWSPTGTDADVCCPVEDLLRMALE